MRYHCTGQWIAQKSNANGKPKATMLPTSAFESGDIAGVYANLMRKGKGTSVPAKAFLILETPMEEVKEEEEDEVPSKRKPTTPSKRPSKIKKEAMIKQEERKIEGIKKLESVPVPDIKPDPEPLPTILRQSIESKGWKDDYFVISDDDNNIGKSHIEEIHHGIREEAEDEEEEEDEGAQDILRGDDFEFVSCSSHSTS